MGVRACAPRGETRGTSQLLFLTVQEHLLIESSQPDIQLGRIVPRLSGSFVCLKCSPRLAHCYAIVASILDRTQKICARIVLASLHRLLLLWFCYFLMRAIVLFLFLSLVCPVVGWLVGWLVGGWLGFIL